MTVSRTVKPALMMGVSGVRGVVGQGLTPTVLTELAASFATFSRAGTIVLARDTRPSGEMARHAVLAGLLSCGSRVIDIGVVPTPTAQLAVEDHGAAGGIVITASHNPPEWNALKFIGPLGMFLGPAEGRRLWAIHRLQGWRLRGHQALGALETDGGAVDRHIQRVLALPEVAVDSLRAARLHVAVDGVNGAGAVLVPQLLEQLGCRVETIFCEPHGRFGRGTEPVPQNLGPLGELVRSSGALVGLALDPDGDRLALTGPDGAPLGEEATLILALHRLLPFRRGPVVVNLSTSMVTEEVARQFGARHVRTPVGEANVARAMRRLGAAAGGEGNGGVIHPGLHLGRDAPVAAALILSLLAEAPLEGRDPRAILARLTPAHMVRLKIRRPEGPLPRLLARLEERLGRKHGRARADRRDGLRLAWPDRWVHVRGSGTEPILRIIAEARTEAAAQTLAREALRLVRSPAR